MNTLLEGLRRYHSQVRPRYAETFAGLSKGQSPEALLVTCADSRLVPNLITSTEPGDIFVVRNVGGLVPGPKAEDRSVSSAIAFAIEALGVRDIIVCGHSSCGAMKALLHGGAPPDVEKWLAHAHECREDFHCGRAAVAEPDLSEIDRFSQVVTLRQLEHVAEHESVAKNPGVRLHAWWFEVGSGGVHVFDRARGRFMSPDRDDAVAA